MPDSKVDAEYVSAFAATLYLMGIIDDFGDEYYRKNPELQIDPKSFSITEDDTKSSAHLLRAVIFHTSPTRA